MKTKMFALFVGMFAFAGLSHAEEAAPAAEPKPAKKEKVIAPEILEKYDTDKDGKLSKEEKAAMKKDKEAAAPAEPKAPKKPKVPKAPKPEAAPQN